MWQALYQTEPSPQTQKPVYWDPKKSDTFRLLNVKVRIGGMAWSLKARLTARTSGYVAIVTLSPLFQKEAILIHFIKVEKYL